MPIIRYTRSSSGSLEQQSVKVPLRSDFDDSVVDKSSFRPNVDDVHNFTGGNSGMTPLYEFPDGKDTGLRLGAMRSLGSDITEIDATKKALENAVSEQKAEFSQIVSDELKAVKERFRERLKVEKEKSKNSVNISSVDNDFGV